MLNFFKKKSKAELLQRLHEMELKEAKEIQQLSKAQLIKEFHDCLDAYRSGVEAKWTFHPAEYDDASKVAADRDYLHLLVERARILNLTLDTHELTKLDAAWQSWCRKRSKIDFRDKHPPHLSTAPRSEWWWWLDRLDELDEADLSTL